MFSSMLVAASSLARIPYSDKPLPQITSDDEINFLSPQEFFEKFGRYYTESLHGEFDTIQDVLLNSDFITSLSHSQGESVPAEQVILERLNSPLQSLVICNMGKVGYGLYTREEIKENTVLFIYSGHLDYASNVRNRDMKWPTPDAGQRTIYDTSDIVVNAETLTGLASFMQHLPKSHQKNVVRLEKKINKINKNLSASTIKATINEISPVPQTYEEQKQEDEAGLISFYNADDQCNLATENVMITFGIVSGIPVNVVWVREDIPKNAQLGFSYGPQYWNNADICPRYFFENGNLIPQSCYYIKSDPNLFELSRFRLSFFGAYTGQMKSLIKDAEQLHNRAVSQYQENNIEIAINLLKEAIVKFERCSQKQKLIICYSTWASMYRDNNDFNEASNACISAVRLGRELLATTKNKQSVEAISTLISTIETKQMNIEEKIAQTLSPR